MIYAKTKANELCVSVEGNLTGNTVGLEIQFEFDETWNGLAKSAVFKIDDVIRDAYIDSNNKCILPWELLVTKNIGKLLYIGVCGVRDTEIVYPTTYALIGEVLESASPWLDPSIERSPELVEQLLDVAQKAIDIANSVRADADSGMFNGKDGMDGKNGLDGKDGKDGTNGVDGKNATINGVEAISIEAGKNVNISQVGSTLTISATGGGEGGVSDHEQLTGREKPNQHPISAITDLENTISNINSNVASKQPKGDYALKANIPTKTSDLQNNSGFITSANLTGYAKTEDVPTNLSQLKDDSTHRVVTDEEKQEWADKLSVFRYATASDKVRQEDAVEILGNPTKYEGLLIEFLSNGSSPNKTIAYGWIVSMGTGDKFLITVDVTGLTTQWSKTSFKSTLPYSTHEIAGVGKTFPYASEYTEPVAVAPDGFFKVKKQGFGTLPISGSTVQLKNNTIYRADKIASLTFTLPVGLNMNSLFDAEIDITIGATPMEVTAPSAIDWQGDDIVNGAWKPIENKRYVLYIYWDGVRYRAISQSQKVGG